MAGQDFTSSSIPVAYRKLGGGLNSTGSPLSLADNESPDLQNIDFDKFGSIKKRNGYTALNTSAFNSAATWVGLHWYQQADGDSWLVGVCGNKLAKMDSLDGTWDDITGSLTLTAGDNNLVSFITFRDKMYGTNGVDSPFQWTGSSNGSAWSTVTGLNFAKYVALYENYAFLANVDISGTASRSRVYWSTQGDPDTWSTADFADINRDDGQQITGLRVLGEELIIFKERSIHKAQFLGDRDVPFRFRKARSHVGCISGASIQEVDNGLVFLAADGFYFFDGNNSYKLSDRVTSTIETMADSRLEQANAIYYPKRNLYLCALTSSGKTENDRVLVWDSFNNSWSLYTGSDDSDSATYYQANCWALVRTSGEQRIYFGDPRGFVYRADTDTDDHPSNTETAINAYLESKWFDYGDLVNQKETPHIYIYYQLNDATLDFSYSYDFEDADTYTQSFSTSAGGSLYGSSNYGTATYAATGGSVIRRDLTGRGRVIRFKYSNARAGETFQIDGIGALPHLETYV